MSNLQDLLTYLGESGPLLALVGITGTLLISGFGLPLPEDIPLIVAGYLSAMGYANAWVMFPGCLLAILTADSLIFALGRRYGKHVPKIPLLRRFLTEARLQKAESELDARGGKFIFLARFLPGLRTPVFFASGVLKLPYWRFIIYDGSAAFLSVPAIFFLAYYFAAELDMVKTWLARGQLWTILVVVLFIVIFFVVKALVKKRVLRNSVGAS